MKINLYGMLAEAAATTKLEINDFRGKSIRDLRKVVEEKHPQLKNLTYKIAVNKKIVNEIETLNKTDEVAFLPPFAGG
jgi:molybdopterin synthase sulfur carrier subunit